MLRGIRKLVLALAVGSVSAHAMAETWDSGGGDNNWGTALNWDTNAVPVNNGTANIFFGSGARLLPNLNVPFDVASVTFNAGAPAFTLGGSTLNVRAGGITNNSSNTQTFTNFVGPTANQTWTAANGPLLFSGSVSLGGNALTVVGASSTSFTGLFSGTNALTKNGNGTLTLGAGTADSTANSFNGLTTLNSGTLTLDKATGVSALAGNVVMNDGTLLVTRSGNIASNTNVTQNFGTLNANGGALTLGSWTFTAGFISFGTLTLTGTQPTAFTMNAGFNANVNLAVNLTGASGGGFAQTGTGVITLSGPINLGGVPRTFAINDIPAVTDDQQFTGQISNGGITKTGAGTLALLGTNSYTGFTILNQGTLRIAADSGLGAAAAPLIFNGGGLWVSGPVTSSRSVAVNPPGGTFFSTFDTTWSGVFSGTGPLLKTGQKLVLGAGAADTTVNTYTGTMTVDSGMLFLDKAAGTVAVAGNLVINPDGIVTANRSGQFANSINITNNGGDLEFGPSNTFGSLTYLGGIMGFSAAGINLTGTSPTALTLGGGANLPTNITFTSASGGGVSELANNSTSPAVMNGNINLGALNRTFETFEIAPGDDLIVNGQISNGAVTVTGAGNLMLAAANTYAGGTNINFGAVRIAADNALGSGPVTLQGKLQTSSTFTFTHPLTTTNGTIETDSGTTLTLTGGLSGSTIFKFGDGTLLLPNPITMAGNFVVIRGTTALGDNAALGSSKLQFSGGAIRADGAARTFSNQIIMTDDANAIFDGNLDLTFTGSVTLGAPATLTVNNTTRLNGPISGLNAGFTKRGDGTLVLSANNTQTFPITVSEGTLELAGGTLNSPVNNFANFKYTGGNLNGLLSNYGTVTLSANMTAGGGVTNYATMEVPATKSLSVNGPGLINEATFVLNNGLLMGTGPIVNDGIMSGSGIILGTGAFKNIGRLVPGVLDLHRFTPTAKLSNSGEIDLGVGAQLKITADPLENTGTIIMDGGQLSSASPLMNVAGGTIFGRGTINAPLGTSSGSIVVTNGTLNIVNAFTNAGAVQVGGLAATLNGGTITNTGTIQGFGTIANIVSNTSGSVEAVGGTLILSGAGSSNTGLLAASSTNKLLFSAGLAVNAGTISLTGGTFDNGNNPINNTGQISGYGTFRSGGLTNNGSVTFTGGTSTINGNVTNTSGKKIEVRYTPAIFTGTFTNNGIFKNTSAQVTFSGTYIENGTFLSDPASNFFENVLIGAGGAWSGAVADRFIVSGDLINGSSENKLWETSLAELSFAGGASHAYAAAGSDLGISFAGYQDNFAWGSLVLGAADSLKLEGEAVYVGFLDLKGGLAQIGAISGDVNVYYDLRNPANAYLGGRTYELAGGGMIAAVPEAGSALMCLLAVAAAAGRRHGKKIF